MNVNELNNSAIALFQVGLYHDAITCLRAAIDKLVVEIRNQPTTIAMRTVSNAVKWMKAHLGRSISGNHSQPQAKTPLMSPVPIESPSIVRDDFAASTMYSSAVLLPSYNQGHKSNANYVDETSVVLLYNLALIDHWRAVHLGVATGLPTALTLYKMALEIILESRNSNIESLLCAILNNMGHIHIHLFQLDEARVCFSSLWLVLQHRADIREQLPPSDFNKFLLSAVSKAEELHIAPAA
jgi:hypothetical protein